MKKKLLSSLLFVIAFGSAVGQVTRLSNNTSYDWGFALNNTKIMLRSTITKTIWAYDVPGNSFAELSSTALVEDDYDFGMMNGKLYFAARTVAEGIELWVSDGTPGGTSLLKDIDPAVSASSLPKLGFIVYNNELYFTATDGTAGRELWKTNGTTGGTVRVKDINAGPGDAFSITPPSLFSPNFTVFNGLLIFAASTTADGDELWKSDGTDPGTVEIKNIDAAAGFGSHISGFTEYGTNLIFTAFDATNGDAIWKTDGTPGGTVMVKDINPDPPLLPPPFFIPTIVPSFLNFQGNLYFAADDGSTGRELWRTDGTGPGTTQVKDIDPSGDGLPLPLIGPFTVKTASKFYFSASAGSDGIELWESDGTGPGTQLLKDFDGPGSSSDAIVLPLFNGLFQGNKFFVIAKTPSQGLELYISDGTALGTTLVKDINPGAGDGYDGVNFSIYYTNTKLYFTANNGTNGNELWQTDGTGPGTTMVADININPVSAGSDISFTTVASNTLFFFGTDGDVPGTTDFFKLDATLGALPLRWVSIDAKESNNDVLVSWQTAYEEQTDHFVVQRSADGVNYQDIGQLNTKNGISNSYSFKDVGALQTATKKWYYRVVCVDKDGKLSMSKVAIINLKPITQIRILSNPIKDELNMVIDARNNSNGVIKLVNMQGKLVYQQEVSMHRGENKVTAPTANLTNGVYIVQLIVDDFTTTERILVQR